MEREHIVKRAEKILEKGNYITLVIKNMHTCSDIIAQNKGKKLMIKVVENIDTIEQEASKQLSDIAQFIGARPIVIGKKSKNGALKENVIYKRFFTDCISISSLEGFISDIMQSIAAKSVGSKVLIDGGKLRYFRRLNGMSIAFLANEIGVSKDTIYGYEKYNRFASSETVERLEKVLGETISENREPKLVSNELKSSKYFSHMSIDSLEAVRMPFNVIAKGRNNYYEASLEVNTKTLLKRVKVLKEISEKFEFNLPFIIGNAKSNSNTFGIPIISKDRINRIYSEKELLEEIYT